MYAYIIKQILSSEYPAEEHQIPWALCRWTFAVPGGILYGVCLQLFPWVRTEEDDRSTFWGLLYNVVLDAGPETDGFHLFSEGNLFGSNPSIKVLNRNLSFMEYTFWKRTWAKDRGCSLKVPEIFIYSFPPCLADRNSSHIHDGYRGKFDNSRTGGVWWRSFYFNGLSGRPLYALR